MVFNKESDFEEALIRILSEKGWEKEVLKNYSEEDLLRNWADILFENNRDIDRLNDYPLTDGEMQQILEQIETLRTPLKLNGFINGKSVSIVRDNPDDKLHFGKEISLKIYDRREIAAGQSRYQIVQQPKFPTKSMNGIFAEISELFENAGVTNFEKLPEDKSVCGKFAKEFNRLNSYLEAAKIQGFKWSKPSYVNENTGEIIDVCIDEKTYLILVLRYKELGGNDVGMSDGDAPYDLEGYITEIDTGLIDSDYMNSRFDKYIKLLYGEGSTQETVDQAETELHKTFATLSQEEQKYANIFLHDIQRGDVEVTVGKSLRDYINEYMSKAKDNQIHQISFAIGVDEEKLRIIMDLKLNDTNINEFGRYEELRQTIDKNRAKEYFERIEGRKIIPPKVNIKVDKLLREFIIRGGFEIQMPEEYK